MQRPGIEPVIFRDLWLVRSLSFVINAAARKRLGCSATVIVDEFSEKLLQARRRAGVGFAGRASACPASCEVACFAL